MPYHVHCGEVMVVIEQDEVLKNYLSEKLEGEIVIVKKVDYIQRETTVYGSIGGAVPFPKNNGIATRPTTKFIVDHITTNNKPL